MSNWKKGTQLNQGQYVIESMLLRSSPGIAYKAIDKNTKTLVTIKTLNHITHSRTDDPEIYQQLIKQAIKIANCRHPNLIKLEPQVFEEKEQPYLVMEYIEGQDLGLHIDRNGKLTEANALKLITKIASALNVLHKNGFIHQDIKPQNIILRSDNLEPILIDFGLAIELFTYGQKKANKNVMDSFTPPEVQSNPDQIGPYTDTYSCCCILYFLLTAQLPPPSNIRQFQQIIPPKQLNPDITDRLNQAILKGMELNPSSRPQTLKEWFKLLPHSDSNTQFSMGDTTGINKASSIREIINQVKTGNTNSTIATTNSSPQIETFEFESITLETKKQLFGLVSRINKNITPKTGKYFSEKINQDISIEMVFVPEGNFIMGSNNNELERDKDESPTRKVKISSFYISKYPITQAQWRAVTYLDQIERSLNPNPSYFKGDNLPVEKVSWYDAVEFCQRLAKHTTRQYRLPTEAEWEYACRGGTTTAFSFGDIITSDCANYDNRADDKTKESGKYEKRTTPVDTFPPNPLGLYDLHGNVWEWCEDHYSPDYRSKPSDGSAYYSSMKNQPRLVRGGSWSLKSGYCRSAKRSNYAPDSNYNFVGFRIVCVL